MYYQSEIISNKNNLSKVWAIIKQVINRKKGSKINEKFMHNNREITDPKAISDGFNNYFVNIGPTVASKIPNNNISYRRFLPENLKLSLFLEPTDETEIKNIINKLKEGAPGQDGVSSKNIKLIKDSILYPLGIFLDFQKACDTVNRSIYLINCIVVVYVVLRINGSSATCPIVNNQ